MESILLCDFLPEVFFTRRDFAAGTNRCVHWGKVAHVNKRIRQHAVTIVGLRIRSRSGSGRGLWRGLRCNSSSGILLILGVLDRLLQRLEARILPVFSPVQVILAIFSSQSFVHRVSSHVIANNGYRTNCKHGSHESVTNATILLAVHGHLSGAGKSKVFVIHLIALVDLAALCYKDAFSVINHVESNAARGPAQACVPKHDNLQAEEDCKNDVSIVRLEINIAKRTLEALLCGCHVVVSDCAEVRHDGLVESTFVRRQANLLLLSQATCRRCSGLVGQMSGWVQLKISVHTEHDNCHHREQ